MIDDWKRPLQIQVEGTWTKANTSPERVERLLEYIDDRGNFCTQWVRGDEDWVRNVPEPAYVPFTCETFPKGQAWARRKGNQARWQVTGVTEDGVSLNIIGYVQYPYLYRHYEMSLDGGETWEPCGQKVAKC